MAKGTGRVVNPEAAARAEAEVARVQREQAAEAARLTEEKARLEKQIAETRAAQDLQHEAARAHQARIAAQQQAEREKRRRTPLTAEEREHMARLEKLANSGQAVPSESMLTLADYRVRAKNEAAQADQPPAEDKQPQ